MVFYLIFWVLGDNPGSLFVVSVDYSGLLVQKMLTICEGYERSVLVFCDFCSLQKHTIFFV